MSASPSSAPPPRSTSFRFAIIFAVLCAAALATLCLLLPLPAGAGQPGKSVSTFLLFLGRFHPILLHFPVALLVFTAILRVISLLPIGRSLAPFVGYCLWFAAGSAVVTASAGWLLAQEGGYSGPIFELHWRCGLGIASLALLLLVLHYARFPGLPVAQGLCWVTTLGVMTYGAHQGGALTHGEGFFTELAPPWLKPLIGEGTHPQAGNSSVGAQSLDPAFVATAAIFSQYCTECHGSSKNKGEQRLHTPEDIARGGRSGPGIVPGQPEDSLLLARLLLPPKDRKHMPPDGKPQPTAQEIDGLRQWIAAGATGLPVSGPGQNVASKPAQSNDTNARLDQQPGERSSTSGPGLVVHQPDSSQESMKIRPAVAQTAVLLVSAASATAQTPANTAALDADVLKIFKSRCIECHGKAAERPAEFSFIDDLPVLLKSELVDLANPQASKLYTMVQTAEMPLRTKADKEAGKKKADPLTDDQVSLILTWLNAQKSGPPTIADTGKKPSSPATNTSTSGSTIELPVTNFSRPPVITQPADVPNIGNAFPEYAKVTRKLVTPQEEIIAAMSDLQTVSRDDQKDTRYVSLTSAHNNATVTKDQLENMRRGARKMLNSLSIGPSVVNFPEVGPEKVLIRVRLRDLGWTAATWDSVASHFPQFIDTGVSAALGAACNATIPILRADWMAANATRPPLYHEVLQLPKTQQEIEKGLGIDLLADLKAGEATRSALIKSGISLANRMIERHETRSRSGYYWASYDFKSSGGKANILENPLGPEPAKLAGGQHAFKHVGGEFVFTLPNGFHGYLLADAAGQRLDGAAPTDIVGDRRNITGRVEITNGLSCIICHNNGIKPTETSDAVRALASKFSADEQHLIERLHPPEAKIQATLTGDTDRFLAALKAANADAVQGQPESVGSLSALNDREVSLETAAAEVGLSPEDLARKLEDQAALFALKASFKNGGTLLREHFLDYFSDLVQRLDIGTVRRGAAPIAAVPLPGRFENAKPIPVELKTDKTTYTEGDDIVITVKAAEAGHLRLVYQNAKGEIYTLFPNQFIENDKIEGGKDIKIVPTPNPKKAGDEVAIVIQGPNFGTEFLAAIVTDQPFTDDKALHDQLKNTQFAKSAARTIEGAITKDARAISRPAREGQSGGARAGFARVALTTVKK